MYEHSHTASKSVHGHHESDAQVPSPRTLAPEGTGFSTQYSSTRTRRSKSASSIVPPSPHISHLASARDLHDRVSETSGEFGGELAKLKKEVARYKRQMVKAEKEAIKARSDLNEVVDELMEVKSTTATPVAQEGRRREPRHQRM